MLVELGLVEQRYQAVREVLEGASVVDVARRYGVARQTVHDWLRRYAAAGLAGLADRSSRPCSCPHQMPAVVEARVVALRVVHEGWGPRRILSQLRRDGVEPLPGRSSVYRALVRHGLIDPKRRRRRRSDYKRWERSRAMELWQLDIMGGIKLSDGSQCSLITGIDDHSRFCVIAQVVRRATAMPVCDALVAALHEHGVPEGILTDNGKVFTGRFGPSKGPVRFDRICHDNGIRHLLTAPRSPTTTGKVERFHKSVRAECLQQRRFDSVEEAQAAVDAWVAYYNRERPHQGIGDRPPLERFRLAQPAPNVDLEIVEGDQAGMENPPPPGITRRVGAAGRISLAGFDYHVGRWLAGEEVAVACREGLVEIIHRGVLVATHARRHPPGKDVRLAGQQTRPARPATVGAPVLRMVDTHGAVSFAGFNYPLSLKYRGRQVEVAIVGSKVQFAYQGKVVRVHPIRHDRSKEHGAFATPKGRPRKRLTSNPSTSVVQVPELKRQAGTGA